MKPLIFLFILQAVYGGEPTIENPIPREWCPKTPAGYRYLRDQLVDAGEYGRRILKCIVAQNLPKDSPVRACSSNLIYYNEMPGKEIDLTPKQQAYFDLPEELLTSEFWSNLRGESAAKKAYKWVEDLVATNPKASKWMVTTDYAKVPGLETNSHDRINIWIPGNPSKWIAIEIPVANNASMLNFSTIVVDESGERPLLYFNDRDLEIPDKGQKPTIKKVTKNKSYGCATCHPTGLNPFREARRALFMGGSTHSKRHVSDWLAITDLGVVEFAGLDRTYMGPAAGEVIDRPLEFIDQCLSELKQWNHYTSVNQNNIDKEKVLKAMNCAKCHNDKLENRITYRALSSTAVESSVEKGHMPPGHKLNKYEKELLQTCLKLDYSERALPKWKKEGNCGASDEQYVAFLTEVINRSGQEESLGHAFINTIKTLSESKSPASHTSSAKKGIEAK